MHLLDLILVSVLLTCINASQSSANNGCGYIEVQTPSVLFYGRNVTITFKPADDRPAEDTNASPELIDSYNRNISYKHHLHDTERNVFTFILFQNKTASRDYYVQYGKCASNAIRFELREPPTLEPRRDIDGCDGCLIVPIGETTDAMRNGVLSISCSAAYDISWTVAITINNKIIKPYRNSEGKYTVHHTVQEVDHMTIVVCSMTNGDLTLNDTALLYVQGIPTTPSQPPKSDVTSVVSPVTTKGGNTSAAKTTQSRTENDVLKSSAKTDGNQLIIFSTVCGVSECVIAVIIAVVCVKRNRRTTENNRVTNTTNREHVLQEEGYARIEGAECQYAVVNKSKKPFTPQAIQALDVENKSLEIQSQPKKALGAGELIYADLDKEALTEKPTDPTPVVTLERPSTPTEYVGIDFARTVALQDANKQDE